MVKSKKGRIFTLTLLGIVLVEGMIVAYDLLHQNTDNYALASAEEMVEKREVLVEPFVFEPQVQSEITAKLVKVKNLLSTSLVDEIVKVSTESVVTEPQSKEKKEENVSNVSPALTLSKNTLKEISGGSVMVAVVIDDMGVSVPHTRDILSLERPVTASFLTYGAANRKQVREAKDKGFEVMLHVPMMPHIKADLAPVTLSPDMSESEIRNDLAQMLDRYKGLGMRGINNHMGSLFTEDAKSLGYVMQELKERNLFFLDSKTTAKSVGEKTAAEYGVPYIARDVFLDNENDYNYIMKQLRQTEKIAHMRGYAVAIGHPRTQTYLALRDWMKELPERKIRLVRLGDLVREVNKKNKN